MTHFGRDDRHQAIGGLKNEKRHDSVGDVIA
jgi:hypothetical protein